MSFPLLLIVAFNAGVFDLFAGMYCVLLVWSRSHDGQRFDPTTEPAPATTRPLGPVRPPRADDCPPVVRGDPGVASPLFKKTNTENCHGSKFEITRTKPAGIGSTSKPLGEIIASGQGYKTKASAEKGIEAVRTSASAAKVVDLTEREPAHN